MSHIGENTLLQSSPLLQNAHIQNAQQKLLLIEDIADSATPEVLEIKEQIRAYLKDLYSDIASRSVEQKASQGQ
jgi:hypothetical protein